MANGMQPTLTKPTVSSADRTLMDFTARPQATTARPKAPHDRSVTPAGSLRNQSEQPLSSLTCHMRACLQYDIAAIITGDVGSC